MVAVSVKLYTARITTGRYINNSTSANQEERTIFFIIRMPPVSSLLH